MKSILKKVCFTSLFNFPEGLNSFKSPFLLFYGKQVNYKDAYFCLVIEMNEISLCILAGISAGIINTLAGSGSIITLSLLSFLGLPVQIANGTNRIGLFFQSTTSSYTFYKQGELSLKGKFWLLVFSVAGSVAGVFTASNLGGNEFEKIVGFIFCVLFFVVLFKPQKYIQSFTLVTKFLPLIFGVIGFYAGFIQAGAGVFMLAVLHAVWGKSFTELNPLKVFIILLINLIALIGYALADQVNWGFGISLGAGQMIGALIGVRLNNLKNNIEPIIRCLLLGLILISIAKFWNLF
ncbi:MAG: hypothetical protein CMD20_00870 [Flavobacteriales bacterium]|nr:hypothetical protein [Flavobacteriales bacterium]